MSSPYAAIVNDDSSTKPLVARLSLASALEPSLGLVGAGGFPSSARSSKRPSRRWLSCYSWGPEYGALYLRGGASASRGSQTRFKRSWRG